MRILCRRAAALLVQPEFSRMSCSLLTPPAYNISPHFPSCLERSGAATWLALEDTANKSLFAVRHVKLSCPLCPCDSSEWVDGVRWSEALQWLPEAKGRQDTRLLSEEKTKQRTERNFYTSWQTAIVKNSLNGSPRS